MKVSLMILTLLCICSCGIAQSFTGVVLDNETGEPIQYASVGVLMKGIGTVTDLTGSFTLSLQHASPFDTLRISRVDYLHYDILVKDVVPGQIIRLSQKVTLLEEVSIVDKKLKRKKIGSRTEANFLTSGFDWKDLGGEVGNQLNIKDKMYFEKLYYYLRHNSFDTVVFRVNIYSVARNNPGKFLLNQNITSQVTMKRTGWIEVDLNHYNLVFREDVIVTLELIGRYPDRRGSILFSQAPPYLAPMYYRETSQDKIKRYRGGPMGIYIEGSVIK